MVQSHQFPARVYEYPFELIMAAYERRFPTCTLIPMFLGSEILNEYKSDDEAIHIVERRCKLLVEAPILLKKIVGVDHVYFIQKNSLNRAERTLVIEAYNESFSNRISVNEKCLYTIHPENPDWTIFTQEAQLDVKSFFNFESTVEKFAIKAYTSNLKKGKEIILHFIEELKNEGITYIPPFQGSTCQNKDKFIESNKCIDKKASCSSLDEFLDVEDDSAHKKTEIITDSIHNLNLNQQNGLTLLYKRLLVSHNNEISLNEMTKFYVAKDGNVDKAYEMIVKSLKWRKQNDIESMVSEWSIPNEIEPYYHGWWGGYDKDCRPIYVLKLGAMDLKGLIRTIGPDGFLKQVLFIAKQSESKVKEASSLFNKPITTWTLLCDLDGLTMRHIWRPTLRTFIKIIEIMQDNFPESVHRFIVVRVPKVFAVVWSLISNLIDENTTKKFIFYADTYSDIDKFISIENLPDFLGGKLSTTKIVEHSLMPKSLYNIYEFNNEKLLRSINCEDIYRKYELSRHCNLEIYLCINDSESVITWDFDVIEGDVIFRISYSPVIDKNNTPSLHSITNALVNTTNTIVNKLGNSTSSLNTDDFFNELEPIQYEQGSSIQGNYICLKTGTYCLSWKHSVSNSSIKKSSRIIYYYEILSSTNYRLSISSLNSSSSGHSSIINATLNE